MLAAGDNAAVILLAIMMVVGFGLILFFFNRYKRCPSNRVLVIYGKTETGRTKCLAEGAAFVWPLLQAYDYLDLAPLVVPVEVPGTALQGGGAVTMSATVTAAISLEQDMLEASASRLLGLTGTQVADLVREITLAQVPGALATMTTKEIGRDRARLIAAVGESLSSRLAKIGLELISVNISDVESVSDIRTGGPDAASS